MTRLTSETWSIVAEQLYRDLILQGFSTSGESAEYVGSAIFNEIAEAFMKSQFRWLVIGEFERETLPASVVADDPVQYVWFTQDVRGFADIESELIVRGNVKEVGLDGIVDMLEEIGLASTYYLETLYETNGVAECLKTYLNSKFGHPFKILSRQEVRLVLLQNNAPV